MKELAQNVCDNATDLTGAVQKALEDLSSVMDQINGSLKQITVLKVINMDCYPKADEVYYFFLFLLSCFQLLFAIIIKFLMSLQKLKVGFGN